MSDALAEPGQPPAVKGGRLSWRWRVAAAGAAALVLVIVVVVVLTKAIGGSEPGSGAGNDAPTALAKVQRRAIESRSIESGTLGYAGSYSVVSAASGTATAVPHVGDIVRAGDVIFRVDDKPVVLLYGRTPIYRPLKSGVSGPDVQQLNANLVALGYAAGTGLDSSSDDFSAATAAALRKLQDELNVKQTGELDPSQAVFVPRSVRITKVSAKLGQKLMPGAVAQGTSTRRTVSISLDTSKQGTIAKGDKAEITLPNGDTTPGVVTSVGKVASQGAEEATIPVRVALLKQKAAGRLDQAQVEVAITTAKEKKSLVVPVAALLALAGGGYAVETVNAAGKHQLVRVQLGLFDDAEGLVQVDGPLKAGQSVVVPAS